MSSPPPPSAPAAKHPGDRLATFFENFFRTILATATLGASITFAKIVQSPVPPFHPYGFSPAGIQYLIALSWLLFILALSFTSFFASALTLWRPQAVAAFGTTTGKERVKVLWVATAVSALLFALVVAAFVTLGLIVAAYAGPVGWVAVAFTAGFGVLGFGTIVWQSPLEWPEWLVGRAREEGDRVGKSLPIHGRQRESGGGDSLTAVPRRQIRRDEFDEKNGEVLVRGKYTSERYQRDGDGERQGNRYRSGGHSSDRRYSSRRTTGGEEGYDLSRYSKASTVPPDEYEVGRFGGRGFVYDDGIREGVIISDYR